MDRDEPVTDQSAAPERRRVVVGVDGSAAAQNALAWALEEARLRGATLRVVCAWQFPFEMSAGTFAVPAPAGEMRLWAEERIDDALESAAGTTGAEVPVERLADYGPAVAVLMKAAGDADLLVVGTRGHSRVAGLFLGSVSQYLAVHAPCPVAVVHGPRAAHGDTAVDGNGGLPAGATVEHHLEPGPDTTDVEEISEQECLALLAGKSVGRLVVVQGNEPLAFPVNYVLDGRTVAVRTDPGATLDWATLGKVAFEIDEIDEEHHRGWSVLVQGVGRDVTDGVDAWSEHLRAQELEPWAGGERRHWIAIASPRITGRRIRHGHEGSTLAAL
jgi:nucleotide-binding universal stress UspA family protein/nitroimidazol reductase NimA-like FMN-containing flavoprotein (pyridoxamine 5'-phosphate oxidase superfamily)